MSLFPMRTDSSFIDRLPPVRGRYSENASMAKVTWFRVGGPADVLFKPADLEDLRQFLSHCDPDIPVTVLGVGSNSLVRDGGIPGVVIRLGGAFADIAADDATGLVRAGAAALDQNVSKTAANHCLKGLEFYSGIPGTIGGALRMNAGAYGRETKDVLVEARALDPRGEVHVLTPRDMGFAYRRCNIPGDWIFIGAVFQAESGDRAEIFERMEEISRARSTSQPIRSRTGGSTFKNPEGGSAWRVIDDAGCRGLSVGGARVSEQHCNFLINTGAATAADLESLGEEVRRRVKDHSGTELQWEIKRIGRETP